MIKKAHSLSFALSILLSGSCLLAAERDTLPALMDGKIPQTYEGLWRGFDRRKEPLEVEVLKEWEKDGVVMKVVRFRIGVFNGKKAMMAGIYGYPKGAGKIPGLVQIHGGGQYADWRPVFTNAKRGYATISISWDGRINAPDYKVDPAVVRLYLDGKTDDPKYKKTTDFGGINPYHITRRQPESPDFLLDKENKKSLRNNSWFPWALAARRAVTFIERQPEVDPKRIGVYGHSMGGKLTTMVAAGDDAVKVAVPSCGGVSDRNDPDPIYLATLASPAYLTRIKCPIMFVNPANDFNGQINDVHKAVKDDLKVPWRISSAPYHNHWDTPEYKVTTQLWLDQHLKGNFKMPETPKTKLILKTKDGIPRFVVKPDPERIKEMLSLDVYYTQMGEKAGSRNYEHIKRRFWHYAKATRKGDTWTAKIPLADPKARLWVYANVLYPLDKPITGSGYGYEEYTAKNYNLSSAMAMVEPGGLEKAGVKAALKPSLVIEDFKGDWKKEWWSMNNKPTLWDLRTYKLYSPLYRAPPAAKLVFEIKSKEPNRLILNSGATFKFIQLKGGEEWQKIELLPSDFQGQPQYRFTDWQEVTDLCISSDSWKGPAPELRKLQWVEIPYKEMMKGREVKLNKIKPIDGKTYLDLEHADQVKSNLSHIGAWKPKMGKWLGSGKPIVLNGKPQAHSFSMLAPSRLVYFPGGKFKRFHATALPGPGASMNFQIVVDGKTVFDSGMIGKSKIKEIDLPVEGAQDLRLIMTDGGNGAHGDIGCWVNAWIK